MGGGVKGFDPIGRRHRCLKKQGAHDVVGGPNDAFGLAILLGCMGARKAKMNALFKEEGASCIVVEFATIVTLNKLYTAIEMREHIAMKIA